MKQENIQRVPLQDFKTFEGRCTHLYKIQNKGGKTVPFEFIQAQRYFNDIVNEEFERTKKERGNAQCRIITVKPRQVGLTTFSNIKSLDMQSQDEGSNGVIAAHDKDTTELIYRIYDRAYEQLPEEVILTKDGKDLSKREFYKESLSPQQLKELDIDLSAREFSQPHRVKVKPDTKSHSGKQIEFTDTNSLTTIFTAGKGDAGGKGGTQRRVHFCLGEDSKICLSNGVAKPIKDVELGDTVITSDGKVKPVKNKFDTGKKQVYEVNTWLSDFNVEMSKDHKVLTDSGWKRCEELSKKDYVQLPNIELTNEITEYTYDLDSRENIRWSTTNNVKKHTFDLDYDFGYLIGYYLAEGHVKYEKDLYTYVTFSSHEDETYDEKIIQDFGHLASSINTKYRAGKRKVTSFYGCFLANVLNDICGRTGGKHIPEWFFKTNKEFVEGVIVGYLAGDGSKTKNVVDNNNNGFNNWKPNNSATKIFNYLQKYCKIKEEHKTIFDLDEEYNISESAGVRYNNLFKNKSLDEIENNWFDEKLTNKTPEQIYNYIQERNQIVRYPIKKLNEKYEVSVSCASGWRKKYKGKSVEYIKNNYGGHLTNLKRKKEYNYITATSICEKITRQIRRLILSLDIGVPSIRFENNRYRYDVKTSDIHQVYMSGIVAEYFIKKIDGIELAKNGSNGKNRKWKKKNGKQYVKIKSIEKKESKQTYDIEIDHKTHDFETPIGIVSNSEAANYSDYKKLMTSINPSVPDFEDRVFFIIESTANGTTGEGEGFYKAWEQNSAEWERYRKGELQRFSGFRPVFIPWYMIEEYELPLAGGKYEDISLVNFGSPQEKQDFLQREQKMLSKGIYNPLTEQVQVLTPEKINWYRWSIKKKCEYDYRDAQRYYPTTPQEAFVASSNCFFDSMKLNEVKSTYLNEGQPEYQKGDLLWDGTTGELRFTQDGLGSFLMFEEPDPEWDNRYIVSADIGRGYEDGDYSVAIVKDRLTQQIVAIWHGKMDQDLFAEKLSEIGIYYNEALIIPESNLETVINIIKPSGTTPYVGEIYYTEKGHNVRYGYWTDVSSRKILIDKYKGYLRDNEDGYFYLPTLDMVEEHLSFIRNQKANSVKYEAAEGKHDDMVIAGGLLEIADEWWDESPTKHQQNNIKNIIAKPAKKVSNFIRQYQIGKR